MVRKTNHTFLYTQLMRWEPLVLPGGKGNAWVKTLSKDEATGARSMLIKFDPGYVQQKAVSEWPVDMFVIEGAMQCGNRTYGQGTYHYRPAGTEFGPVECPNGITRLMFTADSKSVSSDEEVFIQNVKNIEWSPSYINPDPRIVGVKLLREDREATITVLLHAHFKPGPTRPGKHTQHYHDHHEEVFTLMGRTEDYLDEVDGHMLWMPGTYVCRTIGGSSHGDALKMEAPNIQIIRRGWIGETEKFWQSKSHIHSEVPLVVELTE